MKILLKWLCLRILYKLLFRLVHNSRLEMEHRPHKWRAKRKKYHEWVRHLWQRLRLFDIFHNDAILPLYSLFSEAPYHGKTWQPTWTPIRVYHACPKPFRTFIIMHPSMLYACQNSVVPSAGSAFFPPPHVALPNHCANSGGGGTLRISPCKAHLLKVNNPKH